MRNRLWIIILLIVWINQWGVNLAGPLPMESMSWKEGWLLVEDMAALVTIDAHRRCIQPRSRNRSRGKGRGGKKMPPSCRDGPKRRQEEVEQSSTDEKGEEEKSLYTPQRWGLSSEVSHELPERLHCLWQRFAACFKTKTRDTSTYAYHYMSSLLRLETNRNYTAIGRAADVSGENIQHFMSNSPWPAQAVPTQVKQEIKATPGLEQGSMLVLDESANKKAGNKSAGAGRQYNGCLGKVEMSQVGTFLGFVNVSDSTRPTWTWVDGELFLPEQWFAPEKAEERRLLGIPPERSFETKIQLGWKMIQRAVAEELPFEAVACDDLYGQSTWLRDKMRKAGLTYMADVPKNTLVYLQKPVLGVPKPKPGQRGRKPTCLRVLNGVKPLNAHKVARRSDTHWQRVLVRTTERGVLDDPFAAQLVWTLREGEAEPVQEWLVIRREGGKRYNYALSNASSDASLAHLAWLKCQRYFVERSIQDAKSEAGWNELQARKYRGWEHHLALVILSVWFLALTRWEWAQQYTRDPTLLRQFELDVLPSLSLANIRLLLRAALPLPQPSPEETVALVATHLVNRARSRKSRLKSQQCKLLANAPP